VACWRRFWAEVVLVVEAGEDTALVGNAWLSDAA
jgi:hypothetical protein